MFKQESKSIIFTIGEKIERENYTQNNVSLRDNDGIIFSDFNIDPDFSDCVDGFVIVDIEKLKPKKRKRYMTQ